MTAFQKAIVYNLMLQNALLVHARQNFLTRLHVQAAEESAKVSFGIVFGEVPPDLGTAIEEAKHAG